MKFQCARCGEMFDRSVGYCGQCGVQLASPLVDEVISALISGDEDELSDGARELLSKAKTWAAKTGKLIKTGLKQEKDETDVMAQTFFRLLRAKLKKSPHPTPAEVKKAVVQLRDVAKVALVAAVFLNPVGLPGDEALLIGLELVARKFGISLFPSALQGVI